MQAISLDFTPWPHQLPSLQARHVRYVRDSSLGQFKDSTSLLLKAADYLEGFK